MEPKDGLPPADEEYYVMQSEIYGEFAPKEKKEEASSDDDFWNDQSSPDSKQEESGTLIFSHQDGLDEHPKYVFFDGRYGKLTGDGALTAKAGDTVRLFVGNIGPNLISSFHVIGESFDNVYREGDLVSPPAHNIQTTLIPAGGASVVEFKADIPGTYTLVDHAIFRVEKGAIGYLKVTGKPDNSIYYSKDLSLSVRESSGFLVCAVSYMSSSSDT